MSEFDKGIREVFIPKPWGKLVSTHRFDEKFWGLVNVDVAAGYASVLFFEAADGTMRRVNFFSVVGPGKIQIPHATVTHVIR